LRRDRGFLLNKSDQRHSTVLHLLGIDHERLTYRFSVLDFRLTGIEPACVVKEINA
jgi:hypothetical protein